MKPEALTMSLIVLAVGAASLIAPRLARRGLYFNWSVDPAFPASPTGRAIFRRYALLVGLTMALALAITLVETKIAAAGLALILITQAGAFWWARAQVEPHRVPVPAIRQASLGTRAPTLPLGWFVWLLPLTAPLVSIALIQQNWAKIPVLVPVHYGLNGQPDRWVPKTWLSVHTMPVLALCLTLALILMSWQILHARRLSTQGEAAASEGWRQRFILLAMLAIVYLLNALLGTATLQTVGRIAGLPIVLLGLFLGMLGLILGATWYFVRRRNQWEPPLDGTPDDCWHWGFFYLNPADPAVLVEKRFGFGYTFNFARPTAWAILALVIAPIALLSLFS